LLFALGGGWAQFAFRCAAKNGFGSERPQWIIAV
jgi:hypothetical protein